MPHITATEDMLERLRDLLVPVEIRDPSGTVVGHYVPQVDPERLAKFERARQLFDLDEVERDAAASNGEHYTTEEVKRYLQSLEK